MRDIMKKTVCAVILLSAAVLACSQNVFDFGTSKQSQKSAAGNNANIQRSNSLYGAALAAHVAHIRHDYENAAAYYKIVLEKSPQNKNAVNAVSNIMLYLGNFDEAAVYAQKSIKDGNKSLVPVIIVAAQDFKAGNYAGVRKDILPFDRDPFYKKVVRPLFDAWSFAGEQQEKAAIASLNKIKGKRYDALKLMHSGMIYDYLDNYQKADETYRKFLKSHSEEINYRLLDVMLNFYIRHNQKNLAEQIFNHYKESGAMSLLLTSLRQKIDNTDSSSPAIIDTPQKGFADVMFNLGTMYRMENIPEVAQIYLAASVYLNPDYEVTKFALANVYENMGDYADANRIYGQIDKNSSSYYLARLKNIENLNALKDYKTAEKYLREMLKEYPNNAMLLSNLADIERELKQNKEAMKLYHQALEVQKNPDQTSWSIYYALGALYYQENEYEKAVAYLKKAVELSNRNPNVLNYLGYVYLDNNKNVDSAVQMILEAYHNYPYEGHIIDSLGWALFRTGEYDKAVYFLEQAADINPENAVISDHLGDAYWFVGRENEAVYQWRHALVLKEDENILDKEKVQHKIDSGTADNTVLHLTNPEVLRNLQKIIKN